MNLKGGAKTLQIHSRYIGHRNHHVRVTHPCSPHHKTLTKHAQAALGDAGGANLQACGHGCGLEEGGAHVDPNCAVELQLRHDPTGQGFDLPLATG